MHGVTCHHYPRVVAMMVVIVMSMSSSSCCRGHPGTIKLWRRGHHQTELLYVTLDQL
jgi:hypothetical protein